MINALTLKPGPESICFMMIHKECQILKVFLLTVFLGSLLLFASCGQSLESHLERGEQFFNNRKYDAALMQFRAAADIDDTSADAHWGLARTYEKQEKFLETIESLRKVADLAPENLEAKTKLGNYFLLFNPPQVQEAEKLLDEILKLDKNYIEGHLLKASIYSITGKSEAEVLAVIQHAINLDKKRTESYIALSRFYMRANKADLAEATIKQAISANPKRALGEIEYGRFLTYVDRSDEAEEHFKKAVGLEPRNIDAGLALASFYAVERHFDKAERVYQDLVKIQQNSPESRMDLGNFYNLARREENAVNTFNEIIRESPEYARARYALAGLYLEKRDLANVNAQIEALLEANDQDAEALMIRARLGLLENNTEDAVNDLEEVLKKQPSLQDALYLMAQARLEMGQIAQARAFIGDLEKYHPNFNKASLLKIQAAFVAGEPEVALREANLLIMSTGSMFQGDAFRAYEIEQLRVNGLSSRGLAHLQLYQIDEALSDLEEVTRVAPRSASAKVNLAKVFIVKNEPARALELYYKALELDEQNFDALSGLVAVLSRQGDYSAAHSLIDKAINEAKSDTGKLPALYFLKAEAFTAAGKVDSAAAELKKSIAADENYLPSYSAYASLLFSKNQTEEALKQYRLVLEKNPSASVYTLIGMLEDARGKHAEAEKQYRKALELNPGSPIAANNLAWLIADTGTGNLDEAMRLSRDVIKMNPKVSSYYDTLGWVYLKKGFKDQAVEQFRKAVSLDAAESQREGRAANAGYRLRLGMALHSAGEKDAAKREVAVALRGGTSQFTALEIQNAKQILGEVRDVTG